MFRLLRNVLVATLGGAVAGVAAAWQLESENNTDHMSEAERKRSFWDGILAVGGFIALTSGASVLIGEAALVPTKWYWRRRRRRKD